ncbi:hypothetical protein AS156_30315 [Bradyrhizobium macuxiense]|uniref:Protease inhibitor Inh n=1 Tax=Bradyrhizobium macuxiense TaxID=1755647 RepID=A0A109K355_9BRAD|nr:hypothetical protein [Bradyrhizobium macuxiense]KWV59821.1 hypothetical protein AS156_30315 [Bradyrhizobium macuxiense]
MPKPAGPTVSPTTVIQFADLYSITTKQEAIRTLFRVINRYVGNLAPIKHLVELMNIKNAFSAAAVLLFLVIAAPPVHAQLEPDKKIASVGKWSISTARFGVGCVARLEYGDGNYLSISGDRIDGLTLLITVSPKLFTTKLDGSEEQTPSIEIALAGQRWGDVHPYGYRGTPGVVLKIDQAFLGNFVASEKIKVTDLGHEKLSIDLDNPGQVIDGLRACFRSGSASPTASASPTTPSVQALDGKWYSDSQRVCNGRAGETEGLLTYQGPRFIGYENDCKIVNSKVTGRVLTLHMVCSGEGMQTRASEIVEFLGDKKIRRTVRDGGRAYSSVHSRCP